jgi:hypothetical protein
MSFFEELKRRNVFKVGVAYAVAAWILVQVADIVLETFKAPEWTMQFIVVVLLVGFFVAMFFAWAFEMTPEGVKRESEIDRSQSITSQTGKKLNNAILVLMALAIGYLLFDKFSKGSEPFSQETAEQTAPADHEKGIRPRQCRLSTPNPSPCCPSTTAAATRMTSSSSRACTMTC